MNLGFDRDLYIQPFDHRGSFQVKLFGWKGALTDGYLTAAPAEKSGQDEFDFEYGSVFEKARASS